MRRMGSTWARICAATSINHRAPLVNHGHHRYFYQIIALAKPLEGLKDKGAKYSEILGKVKKENIVGWGEWVGHCERKPS